MRNTDKRQSHYWFKKWQGQAAPRRGAAQGAGAALLLALLLTGCASAPSPQPPALTLPPTWQEPSAGPGWLPAAQADSLPQSDWWTLFGDPALDTLAAQLQVDNYSLAAAAANLAQARALLGSRQAERLPALKLGGGAQRSGDSAHSASSSVSASLQASWEPDLWGRLQLQLDSARAGVQASAADLAGVRLAALASLASNTLQLRAADAQAALYERTVQAYGRSLQIAQNRYQAGIAPQTDLLQAQTQLANSQAELAAVRSQREQLEHAIAVLIGAAPNGFRLAPLADSGAWAPQVPAIAPVLPSALLQRRPDIAAAERAVAQANAQIGIQRSAYFPQLGLSASLGQNASTLAELLRAPHSLWALGLSLAQVVFDGGAIARQVEGAQAAHSAAVARYRQSVLSALQAVQDQLSQTASLAAQEPLRRQALAAAERSEQQMLNRYRAGQVDYSDVVTSQASALSAQRALLQLQLSRQLAAVALIQALGGGWQAATD